jgi:hypothetical protein
MLIPDHRGNLIEIMVTKLLSLKQGIQMIGMNVAVSVGSDHIQFDYLELVCN